MLRAVPEEDGRKVLGSVVLSAKLGEDERRAIYRGRHTRLGLDVAVECYEAPRGVEGQKLLETLRRSAQVASRVVHPNLRRVIDVGARYGLAYLVLEYVPGDTVRARVEELGPRPSGEAATIVLQAARGVAAAHAEGIAHGSIGPSGVRVTPEGKVKVADLGFARRLPLHPGQDVDKQALSGDVVALGSLLAFLVTGRTLPMTEGTRLRDEHRDVPEWMIQLLELCLGDGEGERPADAGALVQALRARVGHESSLADPRAHVAQRLATDGASELERLSIAERQRAVRAAQAREHEPPHREAQRPRPHDELPSWDESPIPELLSPQQARSTLPPKPGSRTAFGDEPAPRRAPAPRAPAPRATSRGPAAHSHGSRRPSSRGPRWLRRRRSLLSAAVLVLGSGFAAIPLWRAWTTTAADAEIDANAAFDGLLTRFKRAELEFAAGAAPHEIWRQLEALQRDVQRWTGSPEKRRLAELRAEQVATPVRAALLAREAKGVDARIEPKELGAAALAVAQGSKQLLGSRLVELSWAKSELLPSATLSANDEKGSAIDLGAISERANRQIARFEVPADGTYELRLDRMGEGWSTLSYAFSIDIDTQPPRLALESPREGERLELASGAKIEVRGRIEDRSGARGVALRWSDPRGDRPEIALPAQLEGGSFRAEIAIDTAESGAFDLWILAEDRRGNLARLGRKVVVVALPSTVDPAVKREAPKLEIGEATAKVAPRAEAAQESNEPGTAIPHAEQSISAIAPASPQPLGPSSPATAGDRAARAEDRPSIPLPERGIPSVPTTSVAIEMPAGGAGADSALEELHAKETRVASETPSATPNAPHADLVGAALLPQAAGQLAVESTANRGASSPSTGERPVAPPAEREHGGGELGKIEVKGPTLAELLPEPNAKESGAAAITAAGSAPVAAIDPAPHAPNTASSHAAVTAAPHAAETGAPNAAATGAPNAAFLGRFAEVPAGAERDGATGLPRRLIMRELGLELCLVLPPEKGEYLMGAYPNASAFVDVSRPDYPRKVALREPYYLGLREVREVDWERVMGGAGTRARFDPATEKPAGNLSFAEAQRFVERANAKLEVAGLLELPDETRWEWAARGPALPPFPWGKEAEAARARLASNSFALAGSLPLGASAHCGALDLAGNAKEWCRGRMTDGREERPVLRGGSYLDPLRLASTFHREQPALDGAQPCYGFRVMVRVPKTD